MTLLLPLPDRHCQAQWREQDSGTKSRLRGLAAVDRRTAWAAGSGGTILRTTDGGEHWPRLPVAGAEDADFRDVHARDGRTALVLAVGPGERSRVLRTTDGGTSWAEVLRNPDERGFFDAIAFGDERHGLVLGDPVDGRFVVFATTDGGVSWERRPPQGMPAALPGEAAFAASGTCLTMSSSRLAWFGTGGAASSRVFRSQDGGSTWAAVETPIPAGSPSAGVFSVAFRDALHGIAVGGDFRLPERGGKVAALTADGGRTWTLPTGPAPRSFRSAAAFVPHSSEFPTWVVLGPSGVEFSKDDGASWQPLGHITGYHAVGFTMPLDGWAVGEDGRIAWYSSMRF